MVVTTGSQQLLYLLGELLLDPGDLVIAEAPSYFVHQEPLATLGAGRLSAPPDDHGRNTAPRKFLLRRREGRGERARLRLINTVISSKTPSAWPLPPPPPHPLFKRPRRYSRHHRL